MELFENKEKCFEFSKNAKVILSDRDRKNNPNGTPQELIADAIKWVKL